MRTKNGVLIILDIDNPEELNEIKFKEIFYRHRHKLKLVEDFEVKILEQKKGLDKTTFLYRFEVKSGINIRQFRGNCSTIVSRINGYKAMEALAENGFSNGNFLVANSFCYEPKNNILIHENIPGKIYLDELDDFNQNYQKFLSKFELCGQFIGKVHSKAIEVNLSQVKWDVMNKFLTMFYQDLGNNLEKIQQNALQKIKNKKHVLIHGDYQPSNIIILQDNIWAFDFNDAAYDNPMIDIARFLSQLKVMLYRRGRANYFDEYSTSFFVGYQKWVEINESMNQDIKVYMSLHYLQILALLCAWLPNRDPNANKILNQVYSYWKETSET